MATPAPASPSIGAQIGSAVVTQLPTILSTGLSAITDLIAGLTQKHATAVQQTKAPNSGPVALATVIARVLDDITTAHGAGTISAVPDMQTLTLIVQSVVSALKLPGNALGSTVVPTQLPPATSTSQSITLAPIPGQSITITVGS